jgi:hypothetical protein
MSLLRITIIRLKETPKFLVGEGRDAECVETLRYIAEKYNRPFSLKVEHLEACGVVETRATRGLSKWGLGGVWGHVKGLYSTKKMGISTSLIWLSWTLIGLAYPLCKSLHACPSSSSSGLSIRRSKMLNTRLSLVISDKRNMLTQPPHCPDNVFLPDYLSSRGAEFGEPSPYITWRNYTLVNFSGIWGPVLAGWMCGTPLGRKYTMVIGALVTMAFFFAYTQVRTATQNVSSVSGVCGRYECGLKIFRWLLPAPSTFASTSTTVLCTRIRRRFCRVRIEVREMGLRLDLIASWVF